MTGRFEVEVLLFGRHRELAGQSVVSVELAAGGTVADLRRALSGHPSVGTAMEGSAVALNRRYESDDSPVLEGDEVAVIPPVAGG
jgi:molybdopterin converting factor subunit 1